MADAVQQESWKGSSESLEITPWLTIPPPGFTGEGIKLPRERTAALRQHAITTEVHQMMAALIARRAKQPLQPRVDRAEGHVGSRDQCHPPHAEISFSIVVQIPSNVKSDPSV